MNEETTRLVAVDERVSERYAQSARPLDERLGEQNEAQVLSFVNKANMALFKDMLPHRVFVNCEQVTDELVQTIMDAYKTYSHTVHPLQGCHAANIARRKHGRDYHNTNRMRSDVTNGQRERAVFDPELAARIQEKDSAAEREKAARMKIVYRDIAETMDMVLRGYYVHVNC